MTISTPMGLLRTVLLGGVLGMEPKRQADLESRIRRRTLKWRLRARFLTRYQGVSPQFIIVGSQKAGSSSLYRYLAAHRQVSQPLVKEIHYFSLSAERGHRWYRNHFPRRLGPGCITGESSPLYMAHPLAMQRIAQELPAVKIVVILRDPVARLVSHYRHSVKLGHEPLSLVDALAREDERVAGDLAALQVNPFYPVRRFQKFTYLRRSLYLDQVRTVQALFPGRCFFLRLEDVVDRQGLQLLCEFLDIAYDPALAFHDHNVNRTAPATSTDSISPEILERIRADGRATCQLLGWSPWSMASSRSETGEEQDTLTHAPHDHPSGRDR